MSLIVVGLSHRTAPIELREKFAFTAPGRLEAAVAHLRDALAPAECVLLSTCNRTELYVSGAETDTRALVSLLCDAHGDARIGTDAFEERRGHKAAEHLFRVASGLDSMILGENDIVRQVKDAYSAASAANASGPTLNALFHEALRIEKRARTEMDLSRGAFSVGHAAAQMAQSIFGDLSGRSVLVLGAGDMSEITARHLAAAGASSLIVANRTFERASRLAEALGGRAIPFDDFPAHLERADIVIASTAAPHAVVTRATVEIALKKRRRRELFLIDIALPRDIEPSVGELDGVFLFDLDDLQKVVDDETADRRKRAGRAELLIEQEARAFWHKLKATRAASPIVSEVRAKHDAIMESELARLRRRLSHLPAEDWAAIEAFAAAAINKIAHEPTVKIKAFAAEDAPEKLATVRELYGLESTVNPTEDAP